MNPAAYSSHAAISINANRGQLFSYRGKFDRRHGMQYKNAHTGYPTLQLTQTLVDSCVWSCDLTKFPAGLIEHPLKCRIVPSVHHQAEVCGDVLGNCCIQQCPSFHDLDLNASLHECNLQGSACWSAALTRQAIRLTRPGCSAKQVSPHYNLSTI